MNNPTITGFTSKVIASVVLCSGLLSVGAVAGEVVAAVEAVRDPRLFRFAVNPGHLLHLEEWLHSPFVPGGRAELRSGMAVQMDIIPVSAGPLFCVNVEDGIVLLFLRIGTRWSQIVPILAQ